MLKIILHQGIGDNIYARPYIREYVKHHDVAIETPFPQLFDKIDVKEFIYPATRLLPAQHENVSKYPDSFWSKRLKFKNSISLIHTGGLKSGLGILQSLDTFIKPSSFDFSLEPHPIWVNTANDIISLMDIDRPICLVKFPTERTEFNLPSRNPKMEYFREFIEGNDYFYIDVTKIGSDEWYSEEAPRMMKLDLDLNTIIGMMSVVSMNLFSPSFMLPLSVALGAKSFCIFGGHCKPSLLIDSRMGLDNLSYVAPEHPCNCLNATHNCNKDIDARRIPRLQTA